MRITKVEQYDEDGWQANVSEGGRTITFVMQGGGGWHTLPDPSGRYYEALPAVAAALQKRIPYRFRKLR